MDEFKEELIRAINDSQADTKADLVAELISLLYVSAYLDGQRDIIQSQYDATHPCEKCQEWDCGECQYNERRG